MGFFSSCIKRVLNKSIKQTVSNAGLNTLRVVNKIRTTKYTYVAETVPTENSMHGIRQSDGQSVHASTYRSHQNNIFAQRHYRQNLSDDQNAPKANFTRFVQASTRNTHTLHVRKHTRKGRK